MDASVMMITCRALSIPPNGQTQFGSVIATICNHEDVSRSATWSVRRAGAAHRAQIRRIANDVPLHFVSMSAKRQFTIGREGGPVQDVRRLAEATGISPTTVHRIWREHKLKPHQVRSFKFSNDPALVEKVIDVVGLYLDPPKGALVLCVDECDRSRGRGWPHRPRALVRAPRMAACDRSAARTIDFKVVGRHEAAERAPRVGRSAGPKVAPCSLGSRSPWTSRSRRPRR